MRLSKQDFIAADAIAKLRQVIIFKAIKRA